jgi:hypothetical protein
MQGAPLLRLCRQGCKRLLAGALQEDAEVMEILKGFRTVQLPLVPVLILVLL